MVGISVSFNYLIHPIVKMNDLWVHFLNVILVEGWKVDIREFPKEDSEGSWLSRVNMKWFMTKLRKTRDELWFPEIMTLKVLPENRHFYSTPKMSVEGAGLIKKLGCTQWRFL